ncbi:MAG: hypothetical protein WAM53_20620 [Terrimicrobiaceae bacterium]
MPNPSELSLLMEVLLAAFTLVVLVVYCALMVAFIVLVVLDPAKPVTSEEAKIPGRDPT